MLSISIGEGECTTEVGALYARIVDMGNPAKTQVENGLSKLLDYHGQTIDMSDQAVFTLKYLGLNYEEGKKINTSDPLTVEQRQSCHFVLFMMMVHPDQADTKYNNSCMTCSDCVQLLLDINEIDAIIDTQMIQTLILFYSSWQIWTMGEIQIFSHSRKRGETYFLNSALKIKKNTYII